MKLQFSGRIFEKYLNTKFHTFPSCGRRSFANIRRTTTETTWI